MSIQISTQKLHIELDREFRRRGYDISLGSGLLADAATLARAHLRNSRPIVLTETKVARYHLATLTKSLKDAGYDPQEIVVNIDEHSKTLTTARNICRRCLKMNITRDTTIFVLGGGVIGDVGAFVASILMRGLTYIHCPTTLLSQVDSSIGGKTGVNVPEGKNLLGTFHQPAMVISDVGVLSTLNRRQMLAGYAETLKHGIIEDRDLYGWLRDGIWRRLISHDVRTLATAIYRSSAIKARIVSSDEKEHSRRMLLNFGHTFGHAIETLSGFDPDKLPHGYAVAIGMLMAAKFSLKRGLISQAEVDALEEHLKETGLPTKPSDALSSKILSANSFLKAMQLDKKRQNDNFSLILIQGIGRAFVDREVTRDEIHSFLQQQLERR